MTFERGLAVYDPDRHHPQIVGTWQDHGVTGLSFLSLILASQGYLDQARETSRRAVAWSEELSHPYSKTFTLFFAAWLHTMLQEPSRAGARADATVALATEHGFAIFAACGAVPQGWARATHDRAPEGLAQLVRGLEAYRATGAEFLRPHQLALLAEVYQHQGRHEEGLITLADALSLVEKTDERWWEAELYRLKGESLWRQADPDSVNAEHCFQKAIEVARLQEAKLLELRAAVSLGRLWQYQGRHVEAHRLLSDIYGWFTEGFDTADLQDAKTLLEAVASAGGQRME
jgi:adenylate cyclase